MINVYSSVTQLAPHAIAGAQLVLCVINIKSLFEIRTDPYLPFGLTWAKYTYRNQSLILS